MWGRLLSGVGIFALALWLFTSEFGIHFNISYINRTLQYCYPLILYFLIAWTSNYLDRYVINYFMTPSDVGIYDFTVRGTSVIDFVMMGLTTALMPKLFSIWSDDKLGANSPDANKYFHSFSALSIVMVSGMILFLPVLIPLVIYNHSYYVSFQYIPLATLTYVFRGINLVYFLPIIFFKKTKSLAWIFLCSALVQIPLTIELVKHYGLWGALWSAVLIKPLQVFYMYLESRKFMRFTYNRMKMIGLPVLYSVMVVGGELYLQSLHLSSTIKWPFLMHLGELVISSAIIYLLFRKELMNSFQKIVLDTFRSRQKKTN
jgi:O-antigen/teichoic acid export membrane protein